MLILGKERVRFGQVCSVYQQRLHPACPVLVELYVGIEAQQSSSQVLKSQELAGEIDLDENKALNPLPALPFPLMCLWSSDQTGQPCSGGSFSVLSIKSFQKELFLCSESLFSAEAVPRQEPGPHRGPT